MRDINSTMFLLLVVLSSPCRGGQQSKVKQRGSSEMEGKARMWHGNVTSFVDHPYFAAITRKIGSESIFGPSCGGAFITPQIVMTAAHCCAQRSPRLLRIRYGINKVEFTPGDSSEFGEGFNHQVARIFVHPNYIHPDEHDGPKLRADIALLKLSKPIKHKNFLLKLPEPGEEDAFIDTDRESKIVAIGGSFGEDPPLILKEANIKLFRHSRRCFYKENDEKLNRFKVCSESDGESYLTRKGK